MALANVNITFGNGALNRSSATSDGVAGLILTGQAVAGKLNLDQVYQLSSARDLGNMGVTAENNPLVFKEISAFYAQAGDGAELYVVVTAQTVSLTEMVADADNSPIHKLIAGGGGRIRLVGLNKNEAADPEDFTENIDPDAVTAAAALNTIAESYFSKMRPFRAFVPANGWTGETAGMFQPREASYNRVGFVLAADEQIGDVYSPAVGQVLGRAAGIGVHQSLARVKSGAIAVSGWLADGSRPDDSIGKWEALDDAGYIFYRTFTSKNGLYLNDDPMAAPLSDDYSSLRYGRVIDKAALIAYNAYIDEIQDNVEVDANGNIPDGACRYYEGLLDRAVLTQMGDQISSFETYIDPAQNILSSETMNVVAKLVPQGIQKTINVKLGFDNPSNNA